MNHSMATADGNTHIKIAALALIAVIVVVVVGFNARVDERRTSDVARDEQRAGHQGRATTQLTTRSGIEIR